MPVEYDKYYETENLFGNPYPELIDFYSKIETKGKLLDIGCGQGRDAIALAKLGYEVTGIDNSKVGIEQLNKIAQKDNLPLIGIVEDIYDYTNFGAFDFILLDSMFHFGKKERAREIEFINRIFHDAKPSAIITICIQKVGKKLETLQSIIASHANVEITNQSKLIYLYEDKESGHSSKTTYEMVSIKKLEQG